MGSGQVVRNWLESNEVYNLPRRSPTGQPVANGNLGFHYVNGAPRESNPWIGQFSDPSQSGHADSNLPHLQEGSPRLHLLGASLLAARSPHLCLPPPEHATAFQPLQLRERAVEVVHGVTREESRDTRMEQENVEPANQSEEESADSDSTTTSNPDSRASIHPITTAIHHYCPTTTTISDDSASLNSDCDDLVTAGLIGTTSSSTPLTVTTRLAPFLIPFTCGTKEGWMNWKAHFQAIAKDRKWCDRKQRMWLKVSMQGQAYGMTSNLSSDAGDENSDEQVRPAKELIADLEDRFLPPQERADLDTMFTDDGQKEDETIAGWYFRIKDLQDCMARRAGIRLDVPDAIILRSKFTEGLRDPWIRARVASRYPRTWKACLQEAQRAEYQKAKWQRYAPAAPERAWRRRLLRTLQGRAEADHTYTLPRDHIARQSRLLSQ